MGAVEAMGVMRRGLIGVAGAVVVASGLAAGIGGWRYWHDAGAALPTARTFVTARSGTDPDLFRMMPDADDHRPPAPYPLEFERQFPLIAALPAPAGPPLLPQPAVAHAAARAGTVRRECAARCQAGPSQTVAVQAAATLALVLPPRRPEDLRGAPMPGGLAAAGGSFGEGAATGEPLEAQAKLLGIPLLPFAPAGRAVLRHVADLGERVGDTFAGLVDAGR